MASRLRNLPLASRVVFVVGLAIALLVGWAWWQFGRYDPTGGWFPYESGTQATDTYWFAVERQPEDLLVPLGLVVAWTAVSAWLVGLRPDEPR